MIDFLSSSRLYKDTTVRKVVLLTDQEINMNKLVAVVLAIFMSMSVVAGPYVEYKNNVKFDKFDSLGSFDSTVGNLRVGSTFLDGKAYVEVGKFGDGLDFNTGESTEAGYKFKFNNGFTVKGKVESTNVDEWSHKLETEVRYSF